MLQTQESETPTQPFPCILRTSIITDVVPDFTPV